MPLVEGENIMSRTGFIIIWTVMVSLPVACTTLTPIEGPYEQSSITSTIKRNDVIDITLKNGDKYTIIVSSIDDKGIIGKSPTGRFNFEDIELIGAKKATAAGKAGGYSSAFALGALEMAIIIYIASLITEIILW